MGTIALSLLAEAVAFGSVTVVYLRGVRARRRRGRTRPSPPEVAMTLVGLGVTWAALSAPVDRLADEIFWLHMTQHLLLIVVAAPLLVAGDPLKPIAEVSPVRWRRRIGRAEGWLWRSRRTARRTALVTFGVSLVVLVAWHVPVVFEAALRHEPIHVLEHVTLLAAACAFWWPILSGRPRALIGPGFAIAEVAASGAAMAVLGALLTFSPVVWYPAYRVAEVARGIDPLTDQQAAGLIMWIPAGFVYLGVIAWLFVRWIDGDHPRPNRSDRLARAAGVTGADLG